MSSTSAFSDDGWLRLSSREAGPEAGVCHGRSMSRARLVSPASYPDAEEGLEARLLLSSSNHQAWWQRHPPCVSENSVGDPCSSRKSQGGQKSSFVGRTKG